MRITLSFLLVLYIYSCTDAPCQQQMLLYIRLDAKDDFNIYRDDLQGQAYQLTDNPGWDYSPAWNTKTQSMTYYAYLDGNFRILSKSLEGDDLDIDAAGLQAYNLSPDNRWLVSERRVNGGRQQLIVTDRKGQQAIEITPDSSYNGRAKWSPNSQKIAYITDRDGNNEVYVYCMKERQSHRLTNNSTQEKYLSWAPDSEQLLYSSEYYEEGQPDRNDLFILNTRTLITTQITYNPYTDSEVAWSPDGTLIAFHSKRDSIDHIFVMDVDGANVRQVTKEAKYHGEPTWALVKSPCK